MGMPTGDDAAAGHELARVFGSIRELAESAVGVRTWSLPDAEMRQVVADGYAAVAAVQAAVLGTVRDLDDRPEAVPGARVGTTAATFLVHKVRVSPGQAHRDVAAAHAIDPDRGELPRLGAALAAGEVSRAHVDVAVRAVTRIPSHLTRAVGETGAGAERMDALLTEHSWVLAPRRPTGWPGSRWPP
jgi:hypothetical protein